MYLLENLLKYLKYLGNLGWKDIGKESKERSYPPSSKLYINLGFILILW